MYNPGWSYNELARLHQVLLEPHRVDVWVTLMDLQHNPLLNLTPFLMDGSVTIDTTGDTSRSAEINVIDPYHQLGLDPGDPGTAVFPTRMLQVIYSVGELNGSHWWRIPIFTGPIHKVDRDGVFLDIECLGKESLASATIWDGVTFAKGTNKRTVILRIMNELGGEAYGHMNVAGTMAQTRDEVAVKRGGDRTPWKQARKIASTLNYHTFYNGEGKLQSEPWNMGPVFQFSEAYLTSNITVSYDLDKLKNAVQITGGKPKGADKPIVSRVAAPYGHPLSAWALGRYGVPRFIPEFIDDDDVTNQSDLDDRAWVTLVNNLMGAVVLACDAIAVPHLEEGDMLVYSTPNFYGANRLTQMTIPLTGPSTMSLGYEDKYKRGKLSRKRKKRHKGHKGGSDRVP